MNNEEVVNDLIDFLKKYKREGSFNSYNKETVIKDIVYFLGVSIDTKFEFYKGYDDFIEVLKNVIEGKKIINECRQFSKYDFISAS